MAFFNTLKGPGDSMAQIDKTLPVLADEGGAKIERGSVVVEDNGSFRLSKATDATAVGAFAYFVLVGEDNFQAGMAGSVGQGPAGGVPKITALPCGMFMEFQTDMFNLGGSAVNVGDYLTVGAAGKLVPHTSGDNVVARVTAVPTTRWSNDAVAVPGRRTGANVSVITAHSLWIPTLATS